MPVNTSQILKSSLSRSNENLCLLTHESCRAAESEVSVSSQGRAELPRLGSSPLRDHVSPASGDAEVLVQQVRSSRDDTFCYSRRAREEGPRTLSLPPPASRGVLTMQVPEVPLNAANAVAPQLVYNNVNINLIDLESDLKYIKLLGFLESLGALLAGARSLVGKFFRIINNYVWRPFWQVRDALVVKMWQLASLLAEKFKAAGERFGFFGRQSSSHSKNFYENPLLSFLLNVGSKCIELGIQALDFCSLTGALLRRETDRLLNYLSSL